MDKKKPLGVWIILVWAMASLFWLAVSHYLILSGSLPLTPEQKAHFDSLQLADHILIFITSVYFAGAAVALVKRSSLTVRLFQGLLVLVPFVWLIDISRRGLTEVMGTGGPATFIAAILGYLIDIGMVFYVMRLSKRKYFKKD